MLIDTREGAHGVIIGVDVYWLIHHLVESADLVEPEGVIDMVVCIEDGINPGDVLAEDLLAQVWGGVDEDDAIDAVRVSELDGGAGACAVVARICGGAGGAIACDDGDACGGAGA